MKFKQKYVKILRIKHRIKEIHHKYSFHFFLVGPSNMLENVQRYPIIGLTELIL